MNNNALPHRLKTGRFFAQEILMKTILYGGFHTKMDINGDLHPWRFVITDGNGLVFQRQIKLPMGKTWLSFPRDPIWGDLLKNGDYLQKQIESLSQEIPENTTIHLHERHNKRQIEIIFRWTGISVEFHNIEIINVDPSRISGEAGCEIGSLMSYLKLRNILEVT